MSATPTVTIHVPGPLRGYCGGVAELSMAASTVRAMLGQLEQRQAVLYHNVCDETGAVRRHLNVFVNTTHIRDLNGIETPLAQGDEVTILPAVSGG